MKLSEDDKNLLESIKSVVESSIQKIKNNENAFEQAIENFSKAWFITNTKQWEVATQSFDYLVQRLKQEMPAYTEKKDNHTFLNFEVQRKIAHKI